MVIYKLPEFLGREKIFTGRLYYDKETSGSQSKKGFTLVELIVVIAIIGVLAVILVPTMMNMVTKARVTSSDQTAKGLYDTVTNRIADLEANGGTFPDNTADTTITITGNTKTDDGMALKIRDLGKLRGLFFIRNSRDISGNSSAAWSRRGRCSGRQCRQRYVRSCGTPIP